MGDERRIADLSYRDSRPITDHSVEDQLDIREKAPVDSDPIP